jgi:cold shock CspA family protein
LFGVIDSDDGRLVLFNLRSIDVALRDRFKVGTRVEFAQQRGELAPRALAISPIIASG